MKRLFLTGGALIILDQLTKKLFENSRAILTDFLAFKYYENTGAAFSTLKDSAIFLAIIGIAALIAITYYYHKLPRNDRMLSAGMILLFAGTAGNVIDRLLLGFVRDFIVVWKWPAFNLADSFNCIGAGLIILYLLKEERKKKQVKKGLHRLIKRFK